MYNIQDLSHAYGNQTVLEIPELKIERGRSLGLMGPNGCGKSTLLRLLALLEEPSQGRLNFEGQMRDVTLMLQKPTLLRRSVFENIAYGLKVRGQHQHIREQVFCALEIVGLEPEKFARRLWFELSGGEAQRVSLASRIAFNPKVLLLDEPTSSIDRTSANLLRDVITKIDATLVVASHDEVWLNQVCDQVLRMHGGHIIAEGHANLIKGPWQQHDQLWRRVLNDGQQIIVSGPPTELALLHPEEILLSRKLPQEISARNILRGTVENMRSLNNRVEITVSCAELNLQSSLTHAAIKSLGLLPGQPVFLIFKATAVKWY